MSKNVSYKGELLDLVNDLTKIHESIAFERVDDNIVIRKSDKEKTIPYILKAPASYFDIEDTIAFYKYDDFYRYYNMFKNGKIQIKNDDNYVVLTQNRRKSKYTLSPVDGIINGPKNVNFGESDVIFTLTKEDLDEIFKMNALLKADNALISCVGAEATITLYTDSNNNTYQKSFECERSSDYDGDIQFNIMADRFMLIPSKQNYVVSVKKEKHIRFSLIHDDIELNIYSGTID